jgi:hypothetical protein
MNTRGCGQSVLSVFAGFALLAAAACDSGSATGTRIGSVGLTGPSFVSALAGPGSVGFGGITGIVPQTLPFRSFGGGGCPAFQPFGTNFDLLIDRHQAVGVNLNQVSFQFSDTFGFSAPPLLFTAADLIGQFGHTFVESGTQRRFTFAPRFGCGFSRPGRLGANVVLVESSGVQHESSVTAMFN